MAVNKSSGALYHLSQIAILDAQSQMTGQFPVKDIESRKDVFINLGLGLVDYKRTRVVDIVLDGGGEDETDDKWVEVKSYQRDWKGITNAYQKKSHSLQREWKAFHKVGVNSAGEPVIFTEDTTDRRQFFLDRIHAQTDDAFKDRMHWRFHDFKIIGKGTCSSKAPVYGLDENAVAWIRNKVFRPLPGAMSSLKKRRLTFGLSNKDEWLRYAAKFNNRLNYMVVPAGHRELLSGVKFQDMIPKLIETVNNPVD